MKTTTTPLLNLINLIRENKGLDPVDEPGPENRLREDLAMDSLDLAELTVRLERETGVDVFKDGVVETVGDLLKILNSPANSGECRQSGIKG